MSIFQDGGHRFGDLLSALVLLTAFFRKVKFLHTKFRCDISVRGLTITASGFCKRRSAILEFYFRFLCRPFHRYHQGILHRHYQILSKLVKAGLSYDVISIFQYGGYRVGNLLPVSVFMMSHV